MNDIRKSNPYWGDWVLLWSLVAASLPIVFFVFGAGWWSIPLGPVAAFLIVGSMFCWRMKQGILAQLLTPESKRYLPFDPSNHPELDVGNFDELRKELESMGFEAEREIRYWKKHGHVLQAMTHSELGCIAWLNLFARNDSGTLALGLWSAFDAERVWSEENGLSGSQLVLSRLPQNDVPVEKFGYSVLTRNEPRTREIFLPYERDLHMVRHSAPSRELLEAHLLTCQQVAAQLERSWERKYLMEAYSAFQKRRTRMLYRRLYRSSAWILVLRWILAREPAEYWGDLYRR